MDYNPGPGFLPKLPWLSAYILMSLLVVLLNTILLRHPYAHPELYSPYYGPVFYWGFTLNFVWAMSHFISAIVRSAGKCRNYLVTITQLPNGEKCDKCRILRVARSHHCSVCAQCSCRMDHHCVWINNCVGAKNYKFFIMFLSTTPVSLT